MLTECEPSPMFVHRVLISFTVTVGAVLAVRLATLVLC